MDADVGDWRLGMIRTVVMVVMVCFGWIDFHLTMMESSWLKLEWNHAGLGGKQHGKLGQ